MFVAIENRIMDMEGSVENGELKRGPQQETPNVILVLRRILEDADPMTSTKNSIVQRLCDECGEEFRFI